MDRFVSITESGNGRKLPAIDKRNGRSEGMEIGEECEDGYRARYDVPIL